MNTKILFIFLVFVIQVSNKFAASAVVPQDEVSGRKSYVNHRFVKVFPGSEVDQEVLHKLAQERLDERCQLIKESRILGRSVDFLCDNEGTALELSESMTRLGMKVSMSRLSLDNNNNRNRRDANNNNNNNENIKALNDAISFDKYPRYDDVINYLKSLEKDSRFANILSIDWAPETLTHEGRLLPIVKIGKSPLGDKTRGIWIDGGIHAREWISPITTLYAIDRLLRTFLKNEDLSEAEKNLVSVNWSIAPLLNPDGYEFSHTSDRMWRKNRAPPPDGSRRGCYGIDLNRNYDVAGYGVGASDDPCSEVYKGTKRNSEPEVKRATDYLLANADSLRASLSYHSHGQVILTSWGYKTELPVDNAKLILFGNAMKEAIKEASGRNYEVGAAGVIYYVAGGASDDFAKDRAMIPYVATVELPDERHGFELPASDIASVGDETFQSLAEVARLASKEPLGPDPAHRLEEQRNHNY